MGLAIRLVASWQYHSCAFSSLFIGMGLAIYIHGDGGFGEDCFQFPFHRDGPCDKVAMPDSEIPRKLSVPFSSGWALRFASNYRRSDRRWCFQFPFHRDGPCDPILPKICEIKHYCFQFPFHRDGPCDDNGNGRMTAVTANFQFPFHRDGPCD